MYPLPTRPSFITLMRLLNFTPLNASTHRLFRIGGISADTSYYDPGNDTLSPPPVTHPDWNYNITDQDILSLDNAMQAIHGKLIVDINFRVPDNASYAIRHVQRIATLTGFDNVDAIELGNEPDNYGGNYRNSSYNFAHYQREVAFYIQELYANVPSLPPRILQAGAFGEGGWWSDTRSLLSDPAIHPYVRRMSVHSYPETHCNGHIANLQSLLSDRDAQAVAQSYISTGLLKTVSDQGFPLVMGEGNTVSCHGEGGVSNTFAAALWSLDTAMNMVKAGAAGFFLHHGVAEDFNLTSYSAFVWRDLSADTPTVMPLYYGIRLFGEATADYAAQLPFTVKTSNPMVKVWVLRTRATAGRPSLLRVLLIHKDLNATSNSTVTVALTNAAQATWGGVIRLTAERGASSVFGLSYAGQTWDGSKDGEPVGTRVVEAATTVDGAFVVTVTPISAVLLTVPLGGGGAEASEVKAMSE